jgi:hypothetical protein
METIKNAISLYKPEIEDITLSTYSRRVNTMIKKGIDFQDYDKTISKIQELYMQKTVKSCITSIVVFLKAIKSNESLILKYSNKLLEIGNIITNNENKNQATKKELSNFVTKNDIEVILKDLRDRIRNQKMEFKNYEFMDLFQQYLVLNMYYLMPPLRNDYVGTVVDDINYKDMKDSVNYIRLDKGELVLNRYKTKNTYGKNNIVEIPVKLSGIIRKWMEYRVIIDPSLADKKELLLNKKLIPMSQVNLTHFLNKIFKKKVSSTMLRKSYLTEKYPVVHTIEDMTKDAKSMQHSINMQQTTYRKKK